jgi:putative ABC transport system ATP-binding protein
MSLFSIERFVKNFSESGVLKSRHQVVFPAMEISRGGIISIIGSSGVGKSTLLYMLSGLDRPAANSRVEGHQSFPRILLDLNGREYDLANDQDCVPRNKMGFIFQASHLLENQTIEMNGVLPRLLNGLDYDAAKSDKLFADMGIDLDQRQKRAWQISGGQKQRVAFVRAVSHDPDLLFADEPTASLDVRLAAKMMQWLRDWCSRKPGRTVIWVTHDLRLAAEFADRVIALPGNGIMQELYDQEGFVLSGADLAERPDVCQLEKVAYASEIEDWRAGMKVLGKPARMHHSKQHQTGAVEQKNQAPQDWVVDRLVDGEIYSNRSALEKSERCVEINAHLATPKPQSKMPLWKNKWFLFRPRNQLILQVLTLFLAISGGIWMFQAVAGWYRDLNDPQTCHINLTARLGGVKSSFTSKVIAKNATRPWLGDKAVSAKLKKMMRDNHFATASCADGPSLFGRIADLEKSRVGLVLKGGRCVFSPLSSQILVASPNEPVFKTTRFIAYNKGRGGQRLTTNPRNIYNHFMQRDYLQTDKEVVLSRFLDTELAKYKRDIIAKQGNVEFEKNRICLALRGSQFKLDLIGVVKQLPATRLDGFDVFIPHDVYRTFKLNDGRLKEMKTAALYFNGSNADIFSSWLKNQNWAFVPDALEKIRLKSETAKTRLVIAALFLLIITAIVALFIRAQAQRFFEENAKSLAVLKSYGMTLEFLQQFARKSVMRYFTISAWIFSCLSVLFAAGFLARYLWQSRFAPQVEPAGLFEKIEPFLWATDVLLGATVGLVIAYVVTRWAVRSIARDWYLRNQSVPQIIN